MSHDPKDLKEQEASGAGAAQEAEAQNTANETATEETASENQEG